MEILVDIVMWDTREGHEELAGKIYKAITEHASTDEVDYKSRTRDAKSMYLGTLDSPIIAFGRMAYDTASSHKRIDNPNIWMLPELSKLVDTEENRETRIAVGEQIKAIGQELKVWAEKQLEAPSIHVETHEGITIGLAGTDILITESEADYLKRLKDLLGGSKMVIIKGDLRIEVSD
jgi:hypothetical protein